VTEDYGELPETPRGRMEIMLDPDPNTGHLAMCIAIRLRDVDGTVVSLWYGLDEMRVVAGLVEQALAELEQISGKDEDNGEAGTRMG
jgi:hypothetical protein